MRIAPPSGLTLAENAANNGGLATSVAAPFAVAAFHPDGTITRHQRLYVPEVPVALEFNGIAYAVMMATPADLADFVTGFAIAEGLATSAQNITDLTIAETPAGWIVRATLTGPGATRIMDRVRARVAESSCGLCGIENLEALATPLPTVARHARVAPAAIFAALAQLPPLQTLGNATGAAHAAAFATPDGTIRLVREDVGRHNAMDKLTGAMARAGPGQNAGTADGFLLSTARCSYEIVEKAVRAGATTLVTVSLPTSMAVTRARAAGLSLWVLARPDSVLLAHDGAALGKNRI